jgi:hypothetical protein
MGSDAVSPGQGLLGNTEQLGSSCGDSATHKLVYPTFGAAELEGTRHAGSQGQAPRMPQVLGGMTW